MRLYTDKKTCNGCRACEQVCPMECIEMQVDKEGFWYPKVDEKKCIQCGFCSKVCEKIDEKQSALKISYAVRNKNKEIVEKSSSGGVFFEFAQKVIEKSGVVFGVVFDKDFAVYNTFATTVEEVEYMLGSKYVQSDTNATYKEVKKFLDAGSWVLYSGTPCQISALKAFLGKDFEKLLTVSVICHGVPSPLVWKQYIAFIKGCYSEDVIQDVRFRNKRESWRLFDFEVDCLDKKLSERHTDNIYMQGFLENLYLRPSCYECRAKGEQSKADIILGDYWGVEKYHSEIDNGRGTSAVILNTSKGVELWSEVSSKFEFVESKYEYVLESNICLDNSVEHDEDRRERFFKELQEAGNVVDSIKNNLKPRLSTEERKLYQYPMVVQYLENKINKKSIENYLKKRGYSKVALYAINDFTKWIYEDVYENTKNLDIEIVCVCDKNCKNYGDKFYEIPIVGIEKLVSDYRSGVCDGIIVCNWVSKEAIYNELITNGIKEEHITSIVETIYGMCE